MRKVLLASVAFVVVFMMSCQKRSIPAGADRRFQSALKAAERGNADSMFYVGYWLANGNHVDQDMAAAWEWFNKAAEKNNADAMNCIGVQYRDGIYVEQDYQKAREWLLRGYEANRYNHVVLANLALTLAQGFQDYDKAHEFANMAISLAPKDTFVLGVKGRIYLMQGNPKDAYVYLRKCKEITPHYLRTNAPFAKALRAWADSAIAAREKALDRN
jgi:tetratricopeptide (TPR) repeat protein